MLPSTRLDRVRGSLLGSAVGDALGGPLEGLSPQQVRSHYGLVHDYVDGSRAWKRKPFRWRMPGLYTDDTQQALTLADVLLTHGRIVPEAIAEVYLALANPRGSYLGAHRAVGRSFRRVIEDLERGVSPHDTGQDSAGIGAAMRIAPVSLYFLGQPEALFDEVMAASLMTHRDIRSLAGALAVAHAVQRLALQEDRSASLLFRLANDVAQAENRIAAQLPVKVAGASDYGRSLSTAIARTEGVLDHPRDQALAALVEEANRHGATPSCRRATMGFPPACIPTCLYLLLTTESFEEAMIEVINLGGDADSTGAILGALAGAHYGAAAIPERWLDGLQNREGIECRARALAAGTRDGVDLPDLVVTEWELTRAESSCRDQLMTHQRHGGDLGANRRA